MRISIIVFLCLGSLASCSQSERSQEPAADQRRQVGGPCEGCEAAFEYGDKHLSWTDTLPTTGVGTPLLVQGTVFDDNGQPAEGIIIYIYHTNAAGIYDNFLNGAGWAARHGSHRGWIRTGANGKYQFVTIRPGRYPTRPEPAHMHMTVLEPGLSPYYIDDIVFTDDDLVDQQYRTQRKDRCGSGIVTLSNDQGVAIATRNIYLGKHIPGYRE